MPTIGFNWPPSPHFRTHPFQDFSENPSDKACIAEWLRSGRLICGASGQQSLATERNGEIFHVTSWIQNCHNSTHDLLFEWHWMSSMTVNVIYDHLYDHPWSSMSFHVNCIWISQNLDHSNNFFTASEVQHVEPFEKSTRGCHLQLRQGCKLCASFQGSWCFAGRPHEPSGGGSQLIPCRRLWK
jgi:hypothetical protein